MRPPFHRRGVCPRERALCPDATSSSDLPPLVWRLGTVVCTVLVSKLRGLGRGGASWEATIRPSCCTASRPSRDPPPIQARDREAAATPLHSGANPSTSGIGLCPGTSPAPGPDTPCRDGTPKPLKRGRKSSSTRLASSMVVARASLSSVTPVLEGARGAFHPAFGLRRSANINCTPISPIAEELGGSGGVSDGGVCLKTPAVSRYAVSVSSTGRRVFSQNRALTTQPVASSTASSNTLFSQPSARLYQGEGVRAPARASRGTCYDRCLCPLAVVDSYRVRARSTTSVDGSGVALAGLDLDCRERVRLRRGVDAWCGAAHSHQSRCQGSAIKLLEPEASSALLVTFSMMWTFSLQFEF